MRVVFDPAFLKILKKVDVRIRKSAKEKIFLFSENPSNPQLNNHSLRDRYKNYRSINITANYRAIYKEVKIGRETVAYFIALGTHDQLYGNSKSDEE